MLTSIYKNFKPAIHWNILAIFCICEWGLVSWWKPNVDADANMVQATLIFLVGMAVGLYALKQSLSKDLPPPRSIATGKRNILMSIILYSLPFLSIAILLPNLTPLFEKYAIAPQNSDIIPQIEVMARRFMEGEFPYAPIHDFGYELNSPYMPFHWGPFVIPESFQFDDRWWVLFLWFASYFFFTHQAIRKGKSLYQTAILSILPGLFIYLLLRNNPIVFSHTVELLILSYYFFLVTTLNNGNIWLIGLGLLLCLLSRYSLLFWAPLLFLPFLVQKDYKNLGKILALVLGGILLLYVVPFLSKDWNLPFEGLEHHGKVTLKNWTFEPWFGPNGKPGALYRGTGLAAYFFEYWPGEASDQMAAVQRIQLGGSVILMGIFAFLYYKRKDNLELRLFWLASLKIMLTFFYCFLALPIDYYFIVPILMSLGILMYEGSKQEADIVVET